MFNNRKIQKLENKVNSISSVWDDTPTSESHEEYIIAKITRSSLNSDNTYDYFWQAINEDGSNDTHRISGEAKCIQERGKNMSGEAPSISNNTIVYIYSDGGGFHFSIAGGGGTPGGVTDPFINLAVSDDSKDINGWESGYETTNGIVSGITESGVKVRFLVRQHYDYERDLNYEYYRVLLFDSAGFLKNVYMVTEVEGFETTQHPDE